MNPSDTGPRTQAPASIPAFATWAGRRQVDAGQWLAIGLCLLLAVLVGWRGATRDTDIYIDMFLALRELPLNPMEFFAEFGMDWGFGLMAWMLKTLGLPYQSLFLLVSLLTFGVLLACFSRLGLPFGLGLAFYLPSYFLLQQLMQVRQGLASVLAFYVVIGVLSDGRMGWRRLLLTLAALGTHSVALVPLLAVWLVQPWRRQLAVRPATTLALGVLLTVLACRLVASSDLYLNVERLALYASDEEYSGARGILVPANLRALLLLALMLGLRSRVPLSKVFDGLLLLYGVSLGIRIGFYDFEILSGRVASAVGFAEVLALPMMLQAAFADRLRQGAVALAYLLVQGSMVLALQAPYLYDDYLTPLYSYRSAP